MDSFNPYDAKTQLSRLVDRAAAGEEIIIAKAGRPVARLVPMGAATQPRPLGFMRDEIWVSADFDAPIPDGLVDAFAANAV
jgi:antitoxin (DNA-binding transcriptional repressor) of toxin-antitoxin stability system